MTRQPTLSLGKRLDVLLSKLIASRHNPRKVKPEREAHRRLVASIRAHDLLQPLVVQPADEGRYLVIASNRRLAALREVFRGQDPKVPCMLKALEGEAARAVALAENFAREPMHPLDEAEAFAGLAKDDGKGAEEIAAQFGVSPGYVRQRMKLAALADVVKAAYRESAVDTGTVEAFAAVPEDKQIEVWSELRGQPHHAEHVRNIIANAWIDAKYALFDIAFLPPEKVSRDLFEDRVLIERHAFFEAQAEALITQQRALQEEGWSEVVIAPHNDVHDRLWRMEEPPVSYDEQVTGKLVKLEKKREELEAQWNQIEDGDEAASDALQDKLDKLDAQEETLTKGADVHYAEPVKAVGTVFLILDPDGQVRRTYRMPRTRGKAGTEGAIGADGTIQPPVPPAPPTPDDLSDKQTATVFTHQAIAVRSALLDARLARKRVLALILHDKIRSEALSIKHDANGTTVHADRAEGFTSQALDALRQKRAKLDPFHDTPYVEDHDAYTRLSELTERQLDNLIDLLTVESLTAHLQRRTELVALLARELSVNVRDQWRPDAAWLGSYQKFQLAALLGQLRGPVYSPEAERRKKGELVESMAALFADAAESRLDDPKLAERINNWQPSVLRDEPAAPADAPQAVAA